MTLNAGQEVDIRSCNHFTVLHRHNVPRYIADSAIMRSINGPKKLAAKRNCWHMVIYEYLYFNTNELGYKASHP